MENSNKIKSEFLSVISHELRTPLNIIMGYAALTKNDQVSAANEQHHTAMQKIETQAKCLLDVINSIIEATDIESGASRVTKRTVKVGELFERLQAAYDSAQLKDLALIWQPSDRLPDLDTDYDKLQKILSNLIANAIKFTESGTVTISADLAGTDKQTHRNGKSDSIVSAPGGQRSIEFRVSDTGIGMAKEDLSVVFDVFKQSDSSSTRVYSGVGLGLYIVRRYCDLLGGTVEVESAPDRGSTFTVTIPCSSEP